MQPLDFFALSSDQRVAGVRIPQPLLAAYLDQQVRWARTRWEGCRGVHAQRSAPDVCSAVHGWPGVCAQGIIYVAQRKGVNRSRQRRTRA